MDETIINECIGFDWDAGNQDKNWRKHFVTYTECEQIFFNEPLLLFEDNKHSHTETRNYALGRTDNGRKLLIVFTIRKKLIRVISFMTKPKKIPKFKSDSDEDQFWQSHDSVNYIDWSKAKRATFPKLKPSTETISLRLPESLLVEIKILANKQDIPYQSLMKILLLRGVNYLRKHPDKT